MSDNSGYEVCVLKGNNWQLVRMFDEGEKDQAIAEANHLYAGGERAVCVIWSKNDSIVFKKAQEGKAIKQNDVMANLKGKREANLYEDKKKVKYVPPGAAAAARGTGTKQSATKPPAEGEASTLHYLILSVGVGISLLLFPFLRMFGASSGTAAGFMVFGLIVSAFTAYIISAQLKADAGPAGPNTKKYKDNHFKAKAALARIFNEGRSARWSDEQNAMVGDTHFGLLLYLIGATKNLAEGYGLNPDDLKGDVVTMMVGLSLIPASVQRSWTLLPEYKAYPRYAAMIQRGEHAGHVLVGAPNGSTGIDKALDFWDDFEKNAAPDQRVTSILFTDIVSFTRSQQEKGDDWMRDVVRAHNEIVRGAIASYQGKEVKHTGDGIMASFGGVDKAVKAAMAMHKGIDLFNVSMPDREFYIRIGISSGEPVYMDGDLFGTPVNMAARVLPNAGARQIAVAEDVPPELAPEGYVFEALPEQELKGFEGLRAVYLLKWEEPTTPQEPAPEAAKAVGENTSPPAEPNKPTQQKDALADNAAKVEAIIAKVSGGV